MAIQPKTIQVSPRPKEGASSGAKTEPGATPAASGGQNTQKATPAPPEVMTPRQRAAQQMQQAFEQDTRDLQALSEGGKQFEQQGTVPAQALAYLQGPYKQRQERAIQDMSRSVQTLNHQIFADEALHKALDGAMNDKGEVSFDEFHKALSAIQEPTKPTTGKTLAFLQAAGEDSTQWSTAQKEQYRQLMAEDNVPSSAFHNTMEFTQKIILTQVIPDLDARKTAFRELLQGRQADVRKNKEHVALAQGTLASLQQERQRTMELVGKLADGKPLDKTQQAEAQDMITNAYVILSNQIDERRDKVGLLSKTANYQVLPNSQAANPWPSNTLVMASSSQVQSDIFLNRFMEHLGDQLTRTKGLPQAFGQVADQLPNYVKDDNGLPILPISSQAKGPLAETLWQKHTDSPPKRRMLIIQGMGQTPSQTQMMGKTLADFKGKILQEYGPDVAVDFIQGGTPEAVAAQFDALAKDATPDTEFLIAVHAHGHAHNNGQNTNLPLLEGSMEWIMGLGSDAQGQPTYLTEGFLKTQAQKLAKAKGTLFIMNGCLSGAAIAQTAPAWGPGLRNLA